MKKPNAKAQARIEELARMNREFTNEIKTLNALRYFSNGKDLPYRAERRAFLEKEIEKNQNEIDNLLSPEDEVTDFHEGK